jgi:hypothetical protein
LLAAGNLSDAGNQCPNNRYNRQSRPARKSAIERAKLTAVWRFCGKFNAAGSDGAIAGE